MSGAALETKRGIGTRQGGSGAAAGRADKGRSHLRPPSGFAWILPALVLSVGLIYYCIGYTGYISTLNWDGSAPNPKHIGLSNFVQLFQDQVFWEAIEHTIVFFIATFLISSALGLIFAVILHSKVKLGVVYKVIVFLPVVLAPAIMAPVFREIFAPDGQLNWVLSHIGLGVLSQPWLAQPGTALMAVIAVSIWGGTGTAFILYYAAVSQIGEEIVEAARIDGAGSFRVVVSIVLPSVRGTTIVLATVGAIGTLKTFDVPQLVTGAGPNYATEFLGTFIYRESISLSHVGYAAAASIVLLIVALVMGVFFSLRGLRKNDEVA